MQRKEGVDELLRLSGIAGTGLELAYGSELIGCYLLTCLLEVESTWPKLQYVCCNFFEIRSCRITCIHGARPTK